MEEEGIMYVTGYAGSAFVPIVGQARVANIAKVGRNALNRKVRDIVRNNKVFEGYKSKPVEFITNVRTFGSNVMNEIAGGIRALQQQLNPKLIPAVSGVPNPPINTLSTRVLMNKANETLSLIVNKGTGNTELGKITGYKFKEDVDLDFRGTGKTYRDALNEAFIRTGVPRTEFTVTKWGRDANGKSFPVEWRAKNGAEVNIDIGHTKNGPDVPHIGYQTGGKRGGGGAIRGHILVDDVPVNR